MLFFSTRPTWARWPPLALAATAVVPERAARRAERPHALTLDEAFSRTLARHPDLARFRYLRDGAQAAADEAAQSPSLNAGLQIENAPGNGAASGFDQAETTLSLASVLELGGKRAARQAIANAQLQSLTLTEEARRLDLLAEVARRFLDLLAAQSSVQIAEIELAQRERVANAAAHSGRAGASPESVRLSAEAAVARARLVRERSAAETSAATRRLRGACGTIAPGLRSRDRRSARDAFGPIAGSAPDPFSIALRVAPFRRRSHAYAKRAYNWREPHALPTSTAGWHSPARRDKQLGSSRRLLRPARLRLARAAPADPRGWKRKSHPSRWNANPKRSRSTRRSPTRRRA